MSSKTTYNADNIIILEGLEAVRRRPGMYIGSTDSKGMNHLIYEIVDNSVDEHLAGFCKNITVTLNKNGSVTVADDGRGIPIDMHKKGVSAERIIFTVLHAGGKFDNNAYKTSGGLHGVGASVVNALSEWLIVEISNNGKIYKDEYKKGQPLTQLDKGLLPVVGKSKTNGSKITFLPDKEIFGNSPFKPEIIKNRLHEIAYLNPNLIITYKNENKNEEFTFSEPDGLKGYIKELNKGKETITDIFSFAGTFENIEVEVAIQYINVFEENLLGFCNDIYTLEGGTHINGFKNRFTMLINSYARELGILKDKSVNYTGADTRTGMTAIITIKHPDPLFEGQTKTKLGNDDASKAVYNVTGEQLTLFFDKNLKTLKQIIDCAEKSVKLKRAELKSKNTILEKQKFTFESNGKLANCESKKMEECEIFIVEGDSAGGNAKMARNRKTQAIMPIRGKILNTEKATIDKALANAEIKALINAFGCGMGEGFGNDFNIDKLRYNKIIIMSDADVDGAHISALLLTFFYKFVPDLIKEGHIYRAMPPLYRVSSFKTKSLYIYNDAELEEYRKHHKITEIQRYKGLGEMSADQLWDTTMNPSTRYLKLIEIEDAILASQTTELLMGTNAELRKDFIYENALNAELDY